MATVQKRGSSYKITVNNGLDIAGKQIREYATFTPDKTQTPKQQQKALEKFVFEFEQAVINGKYLNGEKITLKEFSVKWLEE
ncbi:MAG: hypothetical protein LUH47_05715 [Clostridiales bacterium]|nr:hypothetical protein [Clostridiales bacterium]